MTENKTSQAALRWAVVSQLDVPIRCSLKGADELFAIIEKYKRMEGALRGIREVYASFPNQKPENKLMNLDHIAAAALSFDPLSSQP